MTGPTSNSSRLAARPIDEGGTPVEQWTQWQRDFPALDVDDCRTLILVAAHPDDETLGLGATAAMLSRRGVTVQVVAVTDGEAAYPDNSGGRRELAKLRRDELAAAAEALGLPTPIFLRRDGHPDHEATGRAAAAAAKRAGARLLEYPIWMWHWATPDDPAVPWHRARRVELTQGELTTKAEAVRSFGSQLERGDGPPLLSQEVVGRQMKVGEIVFV